MTDAPMKNIENTIYWKLQKERILLRGIAVERAVQLRVERDIAPRFSLTSDRFEGPRVAVAAHIAESMPR